jgi:hypothetical protein
VSSSGLVIEVLAEETTVELPDAAAEAPVEAKEELTLGGCGSGVKVDCKISQTASPSGLRLLSRSPKPSIYRTRLGPRRELDEERRNDRINGRSCRRRSSGSRVDDGWRWAKRKLFTDSVSAEGPRGPEAEGRWVD